jgi:uncharacterized protein (TIGR02391 family)
MQDADLILHVGKSPYADPFLSSTLISVQQARFPRMRIELSSQYSFDLAHEILAGGLVIAEKAWPTFIHAKHDTAVFEAFKEVEVAVRTAGGSDSRMIGVDLMRTEFHPENGALTDKRLPVAEREALSALFASAIGSYKNPTSHRTVQIDDATEAGESLSLRVTFCASWTLVPHCVLPRSFSCTSRAACQSQGFSLACQSFSFLFRGVQRGHFSFSEGAQRDHVRRRATDLSQKTSLARSRLQVANHSSVSDSAIMRSSTCLIITSNEL